MTITAGGDPDGVLGNDNDPDSDALSMSIVTDVTNGSLLPNSSGGFTYSPNADFYGTDSFTYRACDPGGLCSYHGAALPATVTITVNGEDHVPVAVDDSYTFDEGRHGHRYRPGGVDQ